MSVLAPEQLNRAIEVMRMYLNAPKGPDGKTPIEASAERDQNRKLIIESELRPLLGEFLDGKVPMDVFKSKVDGINKRNEHWGFKGIKGQMFFNMLVNVADDAGECDEELKLALALPPSEEIASTRIKAVVRYVKQIGHDHVEAGGTAHGKPKVGSIPYFLSYF